MNSLLKNDYHISRLMLKSAYTYIILLSFVLSQSIFPQQNDQTAAKLYSAGKYEEAAKIFESQLLINPESEITYQYLANCYVALNYSNRVVTTLEKALKQFPKNNQFLFALGQIYASRKNYSAAEINLKKINSPEYEEKVTELLSQIYFNQGIELYQQKKNDEAMALFRKSISLNQNNKNAYSNLVTLLYINQNFSDAKKELEKALKIFPAEPNFNKSYAAVLVQMKEYDPAITLLEKLIKTYPTEIDLALQLAKVSRYKFNLDNANEIYNKLLQQYPAKKEIYDEIIEQWNLFNKQDKLRETYELMQKNFPWDKEIVLKIGKTYENESKIEEAKNYYNNILLKDPAAISVRFALSKLYNNDGEYTKAIPELKKILEDDPNDFSAYKMLNDIYISRKNFDEAIILNKNILADSLYTLYQLGLIYLKLAKEDSAGFYFEKAYENNPTNPFILIEKAQLAQSSNKKEDALQWAEESLRYSITLLDEKHSLLQKELADNSGNLLEFSDSKAESYKEDTDLLGENINASVKLLKTELSEQDFGKLLDEYLTEYPKSIFLLLFKAEYFYEQKAYNEAVQTYHRVILLNSKLKTPHIKIADIYEKQCKYEEAILSCKRALVIDGNDDSIYDSLIRLNQLTGRLHLLGNELMTEYKNHTENSILKERLIEVLHKTGRVAEARELNIQK